MIGLNEIKVLIIEDEQRSADAIRDGLLKIDISGMRFSSDNINIHLVEPKKLSDGSIQHKEPLNIYDEIKNKLKDTHVLFIDLDFGRGLTDAHGYQGYELIDYFKSDVLEYFMPKYIITTEQNYSSILDHINEQIVTDTMMKPSSITQDAYFNKFKVENKLHETIPLHVDKYLYIKERLSINQSLQLIMNSLKQQRFEHTETMSALDVIYKLMENIDVMLMDLQAKTALINQATLTMLKYYLMLFLKIRCTRAFHLATLRIGTWPADA